jgi:hypothetical protein
LKKQEPAYGAAIEVVVAEGKTLVIPGELTGDVALTADVTAAVAGAEMAIIATADATPRTITFGAGFDAAAVTVTASSKAHITAIFDGTKFYLTGVSEF